ncbi:MAG TPA: cupin domain-containing protein [Candidatus Binatia bacterium]|nr:cupin domain-containing protein [Candidatus Binatia bacterium]
MTAVVGNIFAGRDEKAGAEQFSTLFESRSTKIEKIVSHSHSSPPGFWYDQAEDEWVVVLRGAAALEFSGEIVEMTEGDYLLIPRHTRHRVARTSENTIWLAIHVK